MAHKEERQAKSTLKVRSDEEIWARLEELEREEKEWEEKEFLQREKQIADSLKENPEEENRDTKYQEQNRNAKYKERNEDTNKLDVKNKTGLQDDRNGALVHKHGSKVKLEANTQPFPTKDVALDTTNRSSDGQAGQVEDGGDDSPLTITVTHVLPQLPALAEEPTSQEVRASTSSCSLLRYTPVLF